MDPTYNFPVKLRAFGNFSFKISDLMKFWENYIGTRSEVTVDEIRDLIVDRLLQYITDTFAEAKLSYNEIDAHRVELADKIKEKLNEALGDLGLEITDFRIEDTNFTEETEELIQKIASKTADAHAINQM
jgi:membrane protease subunit (stomatin/prohibitin family)